MAELPRTRVEWMGDTGKQIYGEWADTLLDACDTEGLQDIYRNDLLAFNTSGITDGKVLLPDEVFRPDILHEIKEVDKNYGITDKILLPHTDEILDYTSAADFIKKTPRSMTSEMAVAKHAHDGLKFALLFPAGVANDVFLEQTEASDPFEASVAKLRFLAQALGNQTLTKSVDTLSVTGFDFWGDNCTLIEKRQVKVEKPGMNFGWQYRAAATGHPTEGKPSAVLDYDASSSTFTVPEDVKQRMHAYLREQNANGLNEKAAKTAGELGNIPTTTPEGEKLKFSRGCPVTGTPSIQKAAAFSAKLFNTFANYYEQSDRLLAH